MAAGKTWESYFYKQFGSVMTTSSMRWYETASTGFIPPASTWSGVALNCQNANSSSGFGLWTPQVSPDTKQVLYQTTVTPSGSFNPPGMLLLVDMQCYWPGISATTNIPQSLVGTPTLRYANGDGCRLYMVNSATLGLNASNLSVSYTNQSGTTGRALPTTVTLSTSLNSGHVVHTGSAANQYGPFLPLAAGDSGIQNVASVTLSAAMTSGTLVLILARPIALMHVPVAGAACYTDYLSMGVKLPVVNDDACLTFLYCSSNNVSGNVLTGSVGMFWG